MNKAQFVEVIAKERGLSKACAEKTLNCVLGIIKKNVRKGVNIVGFGSFSVGKRKAREGRNPRNGAVIKIKAATVVKFKAGKALKESI
jgi:DNA-binding protein HU-beta